MEKQLLQRYTEGNVTAEEIEIVVNWLDADEAHVREFMALHKLYDLSVWNRPALKKSMPKKKTTIPYRKISFELLKIAAVLLMGWFGLQYVIGRRGENTGITCQTLFVPAGQRAELTLPDSTKVWLNAKSSLTYPADFGKGERTVTLDGEAYFNVVRKAGKPFVVKTEKIDIEVLGTEFNVSAYAGKKEPEVALLRGSIRLNINGAGNTYKITPNMQAKLSGGKLYVSPILHYDYFRWKEGIISFTNETVASIINKMQLIFDVEIDVRKEGLLKHRYSGKFRVDDGVEQVLKVLQLELRFVYTRDRELNRITIK